MQYRPEIDGLRAIAVGTVILFHAGLHTFAGGFIGVDVFFVISGYLITSLILKDIDAGVFSIVTFYERRLRRIMPALVLVVLVSIPFAVWLMLPYQLKDFAESVVATLTFTSNILFWWETGYFGEAAEKKPLLHTWSLAVEEHFYIFFPLLAMALWRRSSAAFVSILILISVLSLALAEWTSVRYGGANFFLTPTRVWELGAGALTAIWLRQGRMPAGLLAEAGALIGLAMVVGPVFLFDETVPFPGLTAVVPILGTVLLITCAHSGVLVGRILALKVVVGIGLLSYSAYLWHQPIFVFARLYQGPLDGGVIVALIALTFILSLLSWRFVEQPFRQKARVPRSAIFRLAGMAAAFLIVIGVAGIALDGLPQRFPPGDRALASLNITEMSRYNTTAFRRHEGRDFDNDPSTVNVLLVGDSHARDFLNALVTAGAEGKLDISTTTISHKCGLALAEDANPHVPRRDQRRCAREDRFASEALIKRVREADHVILVQSWLPWVVELLPQTLAHLDQLGSRNVIVVGRKNFGHITPHDFLGQSLEVRIAFRNPVIEEQRIVNDRMQDVLGTGFVDVARLLCEGGTSCPIFTPAGDLISHDGGHLTPAGTQYFAELVLRHPAFAGLGLAKP